MSPTTSKIKSLQREAQIEATAAASRLTDLLRQVSELASEISDMGDAIPVGIRTMSIPLSSQTQAQAQLIQKLLPIN